MQLRLKDVTDLARLSKLADKTYRDGYLEAKVRGGIAYQMKALRKKLGLSQVEMAKRLGLKQSVISRLESVERGNVTVSTLLNVAKKLDVALVVKFVDYPEFLARTRDMSEKALQPMTIHDSVVANTQTGTPTVEVKLRHIFPTSPLATSSDLPNHISFLPSAATPTLPVNSSNLAPTILCRKSLPSSLEWK